MQLLANTNHTKTICMEDIEAIMLLTDDIINVLRNKAVFYAEDGSQIYFETMEEYRNAMQKPSNCIIENLICNFRYVEHGIFSISAYEFFERELLPLKTKILSLYRKGTANDTFFVVDRKVPNEYLTQLFAVRMIDAIVENAKHMDLLKQKFEERYFLVTESREYVEKEWLGLYLTKEEVITAYHAYLDSQTEEDAEEVMIYRFINVKADDNQPQFYEKISMEELIGEGI